MPQTLGALCVPAHGQPVPSTAQHGLLLSRSSRLPPPPALLPSGWRDPTACAQALPERVLTPRLARLATPLLGRLGDASCPSSSTPLLGQAGASGPPCEPAQRVHARPRPTPLWYSATSAPLIAPLFAVRRLRQMNAKLSSATAGSKSSKSGPSQQERPPSGSLVPASRQASAAAPPGHGSRHGSANGPVPSSGPPADQRQSLPPLTPEEMRRQYSGERTGLHACPCWTCMSAGGSG